jgi:hypothetical protein
LSTKRKGETFEPVTMGHIRGHGVTRLPVYCEDVLVRSRHAGD